MENQMECRVLRAEDSAVVAAFVEAPETDSEPSPEEIFLLWKSSFREESLNHYLSLNWCFGCFDGESLKGVVLQQPVLFWNGLTQALWVEALKSTDLYVSERLVEAVYKTAREKHLQALVFSTKDYWKETLELVGLKVETDDNNLVVKTASWN